MPIRFSYDPDLRIVFTTAEGLLSLTEIEKHLEDETVADALRYRELFDATNSRIQATGTEVRALVERVLTTMKTAQFGPTAVITNNDFFFGMASMFAILTELRDGPKIAVFRDFDSGLNWLLRT